LEEGEDGVFEVSKRVFGVWFVEIGVGEFEFFGIVYDDASFGGLYIFGEGGFEEVPHFGCAVFGGEVWEGEEGAADGEWAEHWAVSCFVDSCVDKHGTGYAVGFCAAHLVCEGWSGGCLEECEVFYVSGVFFLFAFAAAADW